MRRTSAWYSKGTTSSMKRATAASSKPPAPKASRIASASFLRRLRAGSRPQATIKSTPHCTSTCSPWVPVMRRHSSARALSWWVISLTEWLSKKNRPEKRSWLR